MVDADFCNAFRYFGCVAAQINHICVALNLSVTENDHLAINYDSVSKSKIQEKARLRNPDAAEFARILSPGQLEYKTQALIEVGLVNGADPQQKTKLTGNQRWKHRQTSNSNQTEIYTNANQRQIGRGNQTILQRHNQQNQESAHRQSSQRNPSRNQAQQNTQTQNDQQGRNNRNRRRSDGWEVAKGRSIGIIISSKKGRLQLRG